MRGSHRECVSAAGLPVRVGRKSLRTLRQSRMRFSADPHPPVVMRRRMGGAVSADDEQLLAGDDQVEQLLAGDDQVELELVDDGSVCSMRPRGCSKGARVARRKCQGPGRPRRQLGLLECTA